MLTRLHIRNFKSIKDLSIDIKDFNILVGPNNSGKTSVLQTLALLKQSIAELTFQGQLVNVGNFKEAVFNHDLRKNIRISFWLSFEKPIYIKIKGSDQTSLDRSASIAYTAQ